MKLLLYIAAFLLMLIPAFAYAGPTEEFVRGELSSMLPWEAGSVEIDDIEIPGIQAGNGAALKLDMPKRPSGPGKVSFKLEVVGKNAAKVYWGSAKVKVFKEAVVALRPLKGKTRITPADVTVTRVPLGEATESFSSVEDVSGMLAKRPISAGAVIKKDYVKHEAVVRRGQNVVVSVEGPTIKIKSKGVAAEDGHIGSVIHVRTASGKEVPGQVTGPGEIVISF